MNKLIKKISFCGTLTLLTGLHIGGSKEGVEIGGVDLGVVKDPISGRPYIPGSSLKGKLRSLLEQAEGTAEPTYDPASSPCSALFGGIKRGKDGQSRSSRLIMRDAFLLEDSATELMAAPNSDMPFTEVKWENSIDRVKGVAQHPRQIERVPAGAQFHLKFVINVFDEEDEKGNLQLLKGAVRMLEEDYLGGSGSRGYGHVKLDILWDNPTILDTSSII